MKNLQCLRSPDEIAAGLGGLWRTDLFRRSDYIRAWVDRVTRHPLVLAEMSDLELEYPHFGTWFGLTYLRDYPDPVISDLYYLHEIVHASLMHYRPERLFTAWYRKMASIELSASLETECYVYLAVPGLREVSFKDEIWADRYLGGRSKLGDSLREIVRQDRYRALQHPDPMDYCEQQIAAYARQNFEWANAWKVDVEPGRPAYLEVEEHMAELRAGRMDPDEHLAWLHRHGEIPYPTQARLFAPMYWNAKISYRLKNEVVGGKR
jgi:hypothetical protein